MAAKRKPSVPLPTIPVALLAGVVDATRTEQGFGFVPDGDDTKLLVDAGYMEVSPDYKDAAGNVAARATDVGLKYIDDITLAAQVASKPAVVSPFGGTGAPIVEAPPLVAVPKPAKREKVVSANVTAWPTNDVSAVSEASETANGIVLEADIPIPATRRGRGTPSRWPFDTMAINHSFFVPPTPEHKEPAKYLASTLSSANKRLAPKHFIVRTVTENGVTGARIWRTK